MFYIYCTSTCFYLLGFDIHCTNGDYLHILVIQMYEIPNEFVLGKLGTRYLMVLAKNLPLHINYLDN